MLLLALPAPAEERASLLKILDRTLLFPIPSPSIWAPMTDCYTEWQRGLLGISLYLIEWRARFPGLHRRVSHPLLPPSLIPALQSPDVPILYSSKILPFPLHFQRWSVLTLIIDSCIISRSTWYISTNTPFFVCIFSIDSTQFWQNVGSFKHYMLWVTPNLCLSAVGERWEQFKIFPHLVWPGTNPWAQKPLWSWSRVLTVWLPTLQVLDHGVVGGFLNDRNLRVAALYQLRNTCFPPLVWLPGQLCAGWILAQGLCVFQCNSLYDVYSGAPPSIKSSLSISNKSTNDRCWQGSWEKGNLCVLMVGM